MWIIKRYRPVVPKNGAELFVAFEYRGWGHRARMSWTDQMRNAHSWKEKSGAFKFIKRRPDLQLAGGVTSYMRPEALPGKVLVQVLDVPAIRFAPVPAPRPARAAGRRKPAQRRPRKSPRPAARKKRKALTRKRR